MKATKKVSAIFFLTLFGIFFSSCTPNLGNSGLRGNNTSTQGITGASLAAGQGYVLADNPVIVSGNAALDPNYDLNKLLTPVNITMNGFLNGAIPCDRMLPCFDVMAATGSTVLQSLDGKWAYNYNTPEFLEVNTFYHLDKTINLFFANLVTSQSFNTRYDSAIPLSANVRYSSTRLHAYANCDYADNAKFDFAAYTLCFGFLSSNTNMKMAQDSTIIYHEAGHFFQKLQLNFRNNPNTTTVMPQADMGNAFYSEAGSLGEGLSDFYSYYVNGRSHLGEWAPGRLFNASRPISESDPLYAAGISTDPSQRLSYPQFLDYDANYPLAPIEDIHQSGMIISHYLVALSEDFRTYCGMTKQVASNKVVHLISETLAELGDLTSQGTNLGVAGKINYKASYAKEWYNITNPINYRSFAQTFAKNLYQNLQVLPECNGAPYGQDRIETLLDDYGLLLFRTYNQYRNLAVPATATSNLAVSATNRKKSSLISKTLIMLDPTPNAAVASVIDSQNQIAAGVASLQASGVITSDLSQTPSGLPYNNGNGHVSPGEIVAIALNLYNNSNSTMGGIQVLANDWNHVDLNPTIANGNANPNYGKPYSFDQWPIAAEGGVAYVGPVAEQFSPVCLIQSTAADGSSTQWITQNAFRQKVAVDQSMCLDKTNDKDCFIRAVKGVDQASYSKLAPKSNWGQTMIDPQTKVAYSLGWSNVIMFQVSKQVPPGTVVNCRLRVRFTNCEDCYHDAQRQNYDYKDIDYNGAAPFKLVNLKFLIAD
jgi:hypothetical protein